ncbi:MAG: VOC family protein [Neisseriaceae bacterium]|nr:MAG: VOC family protein [Neisseriaceae bacterium]
MNINSLRIAHPVTNLEQSAIMYCNGLDLEIIGSFEDHLGFDGVILGKNGLPYHFEMTYCKNHPIIPSPTKEDLIVLYISDLTEWQYRCKLLLESGFTSVESFNPYWTKHGETFQDHDGYRIVLQNARWI